VVTDGDAPETELHPSNVSSSKFDTNEKAPAGGLGEAPARTPERGADLISDAGAEGAIEAIGRSTRSANMTSIAVDLGILY